MTVGGAQTGVRFLFCETFRSSPAIAMLLYDDHGGGAAKRRRDRRLRMHWRHEQLTLQMALAAAIHYSRDVGPASYNAPRSQRTARAGREEEEIEMHHAMGQMTPLLRRPTSSR